MCSRLFVHQYQENVASQITLLQGLFGFARTSKKFANSLHSRTGFNVQGIDLLNHGSSQHGPMIFTDIRKDIDALITRKQVVVGHSLGGKVLLDNLHNKNITAGIVLDIGPKKSDMSLMSKYIDWMIAEDGLANRQHIKDNLLKNIPNVEIVHFLMTNLKKKMVGKILHWHFQLGLEELKEGIKNMEAPITTTSDIPLLFIKASDSTYIQDEDIPQIKQQYKNATIKTVQGSHWIHQDNPRDVVQEIHQFLDSIK